MNVGKLIFLVIFTILFSSCAEYKMGNTNVKKEREYFSSTGFALIFEDYLYKQKVVNKKINNENLVVMHDFLKMNTLVRVTNPNNMKSVEAKIYRKAKYPKIFNLVISKKIASILELDVNNPYVEILEIKKNKTFVAKESKTYDEEKNVAQNAPVEEIQMNVLTQDEPKDTNKSKKSDNYILIISDFYFIDSANNLKDELNKKTKLNNISVKKINNKKYRLLAGPFENFNALKTTYISLNNLGFENLNIYRE